MRVTGKLLTALLLMVATAVYGVPARRAARVVTQPDGTQLTLTLRGDEWLHYYVDADGTPMVQDEGTGWWLPAEPGCGAQARAVAVCRGNNTRRAKRMAATRSRDGAGTGSKRGIVILAGFTDQTFHIEGAQAVFSDIFNKVGYSDYGMGGSVRDYFMAQSYGQLDVLFDVVGPVQLPHPKAYYGANDYTGTDVHDAQFATDAIMAASALVDDWRQYDWDGDGEVEQVLIVFAGCSEAESYVDDDLWPHEWLLSDAVKYGDGRGALTLGGVKIDTYACSNEWSDGKVAGIGAVCHEFSHCLGLPDMYDTTGSAFGMDAWDVMDYGSYNAEGYVPASYTAYERWYAGWIEPVELDAGCEVAGMGNIDDDGECYVIYNRANRDEYYLLQNIQQTGWNVGAAACGMLVVHVDYDEKAWRDNTVNDVKTHQRMTPVCADNVMNRRSLAGDLWPQPGRTSLTDQSQPAATLYGANDDGRRYLGRPITQVRHEGGRISFCFNGGAAGDGVTATAADEGGPWPAAVYDMQGRRVQGTASTGLYIVDGKKKLAVQ